MNELALLMLLRYVQVAGLVQSSIQSATGSSNSNDNFPALPKFFVTTWQCTERDVVSGDFGERILVRIASEIYGVD